MVLPLEPTDVPGVCRRGSKFVVVYRVDGRQRKQSADTLAGARAIKIKRDGEARALRRGPTLHCFSLSWLDRCTGSGHDSVRCNFGRSEVVRSERLASSQVPGRGGGVRRSSRR